MAVDYAHAIMWLWTAPSTIAIVISCLALQMVLLVAEALLRS